MNRTITLTLTDGFKEAVVNVPNAVVDAAVGYFCGWAIHNPRYSALTLYGDRSGGLSATYRDAQGNVTYSMAGILNGDRYSYHS